MIGIVQREGIGGIVLGLQCCVITDVGKGRPVLSVRASLKCPSFGVALRILRRIVGGGEDIAERRYIIVAPEGDRKWIRRGGIAPFCIRFAVYEVFRTFVVVAAGADSVAVAGDRLRVLRLCDGHILCGHGQYEMTAVSFQSTGARVIQIFDVGNGQAHLIALARVDRAVVSDTGRAVQGDAVAGYGIGALALIAPRTAAAGRLARLGVIAVGDGGVLRLASADRLGAVADIDTVDEHRGRSAVAPAPEGASRRAVDRAGEDAVLDGGLCLTAAVTDKAAAVGIRGGDRRRYVTVLDQIVCGAADTAHEGGNVPAAADGAVDLQIFDRRAFD